MAQLRRGSYHTAPPILALATARASLGADFSAFQGHVRRQPPKTAAGTERARNAARGANPTSHLRDFRWMRTLCLPSARIGPPIPALGTPRASLGADFPQFQGHEPRQPASTPAGTVRARNRAPGGHCSRQSRAFSHFRGECLPSASNGPPHHLHFAKSDTHLIVTLPPPSTVTFPAGANAPPPNAASTAYVPAGTSPGENRPAAPTSETLSASPVT